MSSLLSPCYIRDCLNVTFAKMMANENSPETHLGGLFGGIKSRPGSQLSPYLNIDPSYLASDTPEYLTSEQETRGALEKSFTAIGSSVLVGGFLGGAYGVYDGIRQTAKVDMTSKLRRTLILNYTLKSGGSLSNSVGSIAVLYSSFYAILNLARDKDDEINSIASGALTGAIYKSAAGIQKCALACAFGLGLSTIWAFARKDDRISQYL